MAGVVFFITAFRAIMAGLKTSNVANKMIYFYVYPSAFQNPGGGEILLLKTKEYLEKSGITVKLFDMWQDRFKEGDLLHVFGSVKEALGLMETAKSKGVKIVQCPIIWYNWQSALCMAYSTKERIMYVLRQAAKEFFPAVPSSRKKMMELADIVLAGSDMEGEQIARYFLIPRDKIRTVHYGADKIYEQAKPDFFEKKHDLKDFVLTVGRIEPRKNQLRLIKAFKNSNYQLVIIGAPVAHHMDYYERCLSEAGPNVKFLGPLASDSVELLSAYAACKVFVSPAWFETPGLAALEAGLSGANVVITQGGSTREYFKHFAEYVNPASVEDIRNKIENAMKTEKTKALRDYIRKNYLWEHSAQKTAAYYKELGVQI